MSYDDTAFLDLESTLCSEAWQGVRNVVSEQAKSGKYYNQF